MALGPKGEKNGWKRKPEHESSREVTIESGEVLLEQTGQNQR